MTDPAVARDDMCKGLKKQLAFGVFEKDLLPSITPAGEVINCPGKLQRNRPCYGALLSARLFDCKA